MSFDKRIDAATISINGSTFFTARNVAMSMARMGVTFGRGSVRNVRAGQGESDAAW